MATAATTTATTTGMMPATTATAAVNLNDVLCGQGNLVNSHSGNQRFRTIAREYQQEYWSRQKNIEKRETVLLILARINDSGGRFLNQMTLLLLLILPG